MKSGGSRVGENLKIGQKRFGERTRFEFAPDKLIYFVRNRDGEFQFSAPYEAIKINEPVTATKRTPPAIQNLFVFVFLFSGFAATARGNSQASTIVMSGLAAMSAIAFLVGYFFNFFRISTSFFQNTAAGGTKVTCRIGVFGDADHDRIVQELGNRWRQRHKELYGAVNLNNDPVQEFAKFEWLKKQGIIDDIEYAFAVEQLKTLDSQREPPKLVDRSFN